MAATRIQEWQSYPSCLPTCFYDVDRKTSGRMLDAAEDRLFSSDDDVEVWTHEVSLDGTLLDYLDKIHLSMLNDGF